MKILYLALSVVFSSLILILAFENISAQCSNMFFFFYGVKSNPTIVTLTIALLGIFTGAVYHALFTRMMENTEDNSDF